MKLTETATILSQETENFGVGGMALLTNMAAPRLLL